MKINLTIGFADTPDGQMESLVLTERIGEPTRQTVQLNQLQLRWAAVEASALKEVAHMMSTTKPGLIQLVFALYQSEE